MPRRDQVKASLIEGEVVEAKDPRLERLVDEVDFAIYPPKHEGKLPTYGCILTDTIPENAGECLSVDKVPGEIARELADGISTFLIRHRGKVKRVALQASARDEELDLIELSRRWKGVLVHRNRRDVVRVFTPKGIRIYEDGEWVLRPYARSVFSDVEAVAPQVTWDELDGLLSFAFHVLSPANVGATLVWWLAPPKSSITGGTDLSKAGIRISDQGSFPALRALLRRHDGATFLSPAGVVRSLGHHLKYSKKATQFIKEVGGTRHTSAKRYSFDEPRVLIVVVSEDGPVSVFSDGVKVTELAQYAPGELADELRRIAPIKAQDVLDGTRTETCPKCGKTIEVEVILVLGLRTHETGECPICDTVVHETNCWQINTRVVKSLPK